MRIKMNYDHNFVELLNKVKTNYSEELISQDGISDRQLDMVEFSKKFMVSDNTANASIDENGNVSDINMATYNKEVFKPLSKLNGYFLMWKELKRHYGLETANESVERAIIGDIYVHDSTNFSLAYSYHPHNTIFIKEGETIQNVTLEMLFDRYKDEVKFTNDSESINLREKDILIKDGEEYTKLKNILRHRSHNDLIMMETKDGRTTLVTEDHPVVLEDGAEIDANKVSIGMKLKKDDFIFKVNKGKVVDKSSDELYIIGAMIADGCTQDYSCVLTQNDAINTPFYKRISNVYDNPSVYPSKSNQISFGNKDTALQMKKDIGILANNKHLPAYWTQLTEDQLISLVSGIIDTDGSVNNTSGVIDVRVVSFGLVNQIAQVVESLGCTRVRTSYVGFYKRSPKGFEQKQPLYRVSFVPTEKFAQYSSKVYENQDLCFRVRGKDGRWEGTGINKLEVISYEGNWVYDVSTDTELFSCNRLIQHNCFNYTAYDIVLGGLPDWTGVAKTTAPKTLKAFTRQIINFLISAGSQQMGATGIADMLIFFAWFVQRDLEQHYVEEGLDINLFKDKKSFESAVWKHAESELISFIYDINFNYRSDQTLFTNVSLYDNYFLDSLLKDINMVEAPFKIDKKIVMKVQEMYMRVMNNELRRTPLTYPVTTATFTRYDEEDITVTFENGLQKKYNQFSDIVVKRGIGQESINIKKLTEDDYVIDKDLSDILKPSKIESKTGKINLLRDTEFIKLVAKENLEYQFINMFNGESSVLSSCCFVGETLTTVYDKKEGEINLTFKEYEVKYKDSKDLPLIKQKSTWEKGKLTKVKGGDKQLYKIVTEQGEYFPTHDHIFPVMRIVNGGKSDRVDVLVTDLDINTDMFIYTIDDNEILFNIDSIEKIERKDDYVYCYEMDFQGNPFFTLADGCYTHNCRLRSNMDDLEKESFGSIGGSGSAKIGSIGVTTINMPRVAFKFKKGEIDNIDDELKHLTDLSIRINYARRTLIKDKINRGMLPMYSDGFMILDRQFSTTGILGGFEFLEILGKDILNKEGLEYQKHVLKVIRDYQDELHKTDTLYEKVPFNIEQIPAETAAVKLARKDEIMGYNDVGYKLYANQFVPLQKTANMLDRIHVAGALDNSGHLNGGSILHLNVDQKVEDLDKMVELIYSVAKEGVAYWAINFNLVYCKSCGKFEIDEAGRTTCKHCGSADIEQYQRVVGFLTKVSAWSDTKQEEDYKKRQNYKGIA